MMKFEILAQQSDYHVFIPLTIIAPQATTSEVSVPSPPSLPSLPVESYNSGDCVCCQMNESTHRIMACGHTCLCASCYVILDTSDHPYCPLCRTPMHVITPPSLPVAEKSTKSEC